MPTRNDTMDAVLESLDICGDVALAIPPRTILYFELALGQPDLAYRFVFEDVAWTKTQVSRDAMLMEIKETLDAGTGTDVSEVIQEGTYADVCALGTGMTTQLMQHRQWRRKNLLKYQLVFRESCGDGMPDPVRISRS